MAAKPQPIASLMFDFWMPRITVSRIEMLVPCFQKLYADLGMRTVCPTSGAIDVLSETVLSHTAAI